MKETIGMIRILLEMSTDTYLKCKCIFLAVSTTEHQGMHDFINKLFELTDKRRPLSIEMKKGGAA